MEATKKGKWILFRSKYQCDINIILRKFMFGDNLFILAISNQIKCNYIINAFVMSTLRRRCLQCQPNRGKKGQGV